jgi:hypothetical protein
MKSEAEIIKSVEDFHDENACSMMVVETHVPLNRVKAG